MLSIRPLDPATDRATVEAFFHSIADYVRMERGEDPGPQVAEEFFTDAPPGCDPARSHRLGLFDNGQLMAVAEMAPGYPDPDAAYLGFLAVSEAARGKSLGPHLLRHIETLACQAGAQALCLAVLDANPRGRAFWEREGFAMTDKFGSLTFGQKTQIARRMKKAL